MMLARHVVVLRSLSLRIHYRACLADFLDRLCTHILAAEGDGKWVWHEGNFAEYEQDRRKRYDGKDPFEVGAGAFATLA